MSENEQQPWTKQVRKLVREATEPLEKRLGELSSRLNGLSQPTPKNEEETEVPIYKCKGKDCNFATDDLDAYIDHKISEKTPKAAEVPEETEPVKKRHETVDEFMNCPECFPKFEKAFVARGYVKKEAEKPKQGLRI